MINVFYAGFRFQNPNHEILLRELARRAEPDLKVTDVSSRRIADVARSAKESSLIGIDSSLYAAAYLSSPVTPTYVLVDWKGGAFYQEVLRHLLEVDAPRLYVSNWDLHDPAMAAGLDQLLHRIDAIAWPYEKEPQDLDAVPGPYRDAWMFNAANPVTVWKRICDRVSIRIELLFALGAEEFVRRPRPKVWDLCVPGSPYATRRIVLRMAKGHGLSVAPYPTLDATIAKTLAKIGRLAPRLALTVWRIRLRRLAHASLVKRSRVSFVCGSGVRYPVRKFFEIPAGRSAMVAYPSVGFAHYGFLDGENVICEAPEGAAGAARRLVGNEGLRKALADRAWDMVHRLHSVSQRASDLIECMRRLEKGRLKRAEFLDGRFEIR